MKISAFSGLFALVMCALLAIIVSCHKSGKQETISDPSVFSSCEDFSTIERVFRNPDDMKLAVYWYWVNDNISKEGVVADLKSMKEVGINRAFIGNVTADLPYGDIKVLSPQWWEVMSEALRTAGELGIEIGIFNCPGWSQSGGPWVKPEQSMRYLDCTTQTIESSGETIVLPLNEVAPDAMEDVRVLAYPAIPESTASTRVVKSEGVSAEAALEGTPGKTYRTLIITPAAGTSIITEGVLLAQQDGAWQKVQDIHIDRSNANVNVGFRPYAPLVVAIPECDASSFKLVLNEQGKGTLDVKISTRAYVDRVQEKTLAKMFQTPLPMWDAYMWQTQPAVPDSACINPELIVDLTDKVKDGVLTWDAPEGRWTISRHSVRTTGQTNSPASPEGTGLEIDKMSREHVEYHFDQFIGEILRRIPADERKTFKVVVEDSYETGGMDWTDNMVEAFQEVYGYDPTPYLPVLNGDIVGSADISERFLWDLRRLIADRVAKEYVGGLREVSNRHGLTTWLECYGHWGFPGEFLQYGGQSDEVAGEFWSEGSLGDIENRAASSCAHIYGKRKTWAESCTSGGPVFSRYPRIMKQRLDRFFSEGINSTLLHLFIEQPYEDKNPGVDAWFGNEFNRKNIWFSHMDEFGRYMKRCNAMLQQGLYSADVAYFIGEDTPKMTGVCDPELPKGYSFDYINAEVLMNRAEMRNGRLTLPDGMSYAMMVLPRQKTMRPELLAKIKELVSDGLVVLGPAPECSPSLAGYPDADAQVRKIATDLWGDGSRSVYEYGYGKVYTDGQSVEKVLNDLGIKPDMIAKDNPEAPVLFIHRSLPKGDIYFVSNQSDEPLDINAVFRAAGRAPQLWNPVTGEIRVLPEYTREKGFTTVPLRFAPLESSFIVFGAESVKGNRYDRNYPAEELLADIPANWSVSFPGDRGPSDKITMESLCDWSQSDNDAIRYYSGKAIYRNVFTLEGKPKKDVYIDLGNVMVMAKVKVNGHYAGGAWTYPYRVNITEFVQAGENVVEVEVVNNWQNRIIGDMRLPESERKVWMTVNPWSAASPLQTSGLLGPVRVVEFK